MNLLSSRYILFIEYFDKYKSDNLGLCLSFLLHLIILISAIGLPNFFGPKQISVSNIIPIEIVNITNVTSIPKNIIKIKPKNISNTVNKVKEKKFNSSDNQEIKKIDIQNKPKLKEIKIDEKALKKEREISKLPEKKEAPLKLEETKIEIKENNFESLPTKKVKPKLKPKNKTIEIKNIKKTDVVIQSKPKIKKEPDFNIASMLKDLRNESLTKKIESDIDKKKSSVIEKTAEKLEEGSELSISEIDLVLQQLSRCFIAPAGAEIETTMFVKISAKIQRNRQVYENSIRIVDTNISKSSSLYGPITESAMRTLLNPDCIPLKLPENKYDLWKDLTMKFDYSVMRGN